MKKIKTMLVCVIVPVIVVVLICRWPSKERCVDAVIDLYIKIVCEK